MRVEASYQFNMEGDKAKGLREQSAVDDALFQFSTFALACKEGKKKSLSSELKLQPMKEVSGVFYLGAG